MMPFSTISGVAIPLGEKNVDTDVILPAKYLKVVTRTGLGQFAFATMRQGEHGNIFDSDRNRGAPILIAGANFGCGSSREHAPWALMDMGVRAILAPSFADIFSGNCFKNGLLLVELPLTAIERLLSVAGRCEIEVNLQDQRVSSTEGDSFAFAYDPFRKACLIGGLDEIALTERHLEKIDRFAVARAAKHPWAASIRPELLNRETQ